ncbi:hypothetical protein SNE35_22235 [Paucibacter sp. R3-3]|uniref:Glycosyltransferase RgtA/B/C/D-like domain-containing protein n=1 Tax=Roseateles agri TaxID=3098619 RepID=A0ABU5DND3_9BURK|nr:hypothetical protein [Paucibacter sp. R3-3]MDY0747241.1 hypothetical protein [Paucibacter sp. R3-3]
MRTDNLASRHSMAAALAVGAAVLLTYTLLCSAIKVDDVDRYWYELGTNRFFWDLGHLWMQPLALLLYRASGDVLGVNHSLEAINVISVALGCAVFFTTLREAGHSTLKSVAAVAFVAASFDLMTLGPTAHIKLMVFPALALTLHHALRWERADAAGQSTLRHQLASGAWAGLSVNLLVSVLPQMLLLAVFMLIRGARRYGLAQTVRRMLPYALALAVVGFGLLLAAYVVARQSGTTSAQDLLGFTLGGLKEKEDLHVGFPSLKEMPLRFGFSLVNNFAFLPSVGTLGRAYLWGWLADVRPVLPSLLGQALLAAMVGALLLATFAVGARQALKSKAEPGLLSPWAFVLGAAAFSYYYNLNDPEHWFQFTMPVALLALQLRRRWLTIWLLCIATPVLLTVNLVGYGIPKARFALAERQQALQTALGMQGLYVGFAAYPGEPDSSLMDTPGLERFNIDLVQANEIKADVDALLAKLDEHVDAALARGGRVLVFRALDDMDWRGPVMQVALAGLPRAKLHAHLAERYVISGPVDAGGFPAYELRALDLIRTRASP